MSSNNDSTPSFNQAAAPINTSTISPTSGNKPGPSPSTDTATPTSANTLQVPSTANSTTNTTTPSTTAPTEGNQTQTQGAKSHRSRSRSNRKPNANKAAGKSATSSRSTSANNQVESTSQPSQDQAEAKGQQGGETKASPTTTASGTAPAPQKRQPAPKKKSKVQLANTPSTGKTDNPPSQTPSQTSKQAIATPDSTQPVTSGNGSHKNKKGNAGARTPAANVTAAQANGAQNGTASGNTKVSTKPTPNLPGGEKASQSSSKKSRSNKNKQPGTGEKIPGKSPTHSQTILPASLNAMDAAKLASKEREKQLGTVEGLRQKIDELKTLPPAPTSVPGGSVSRKSSLSLAPDGITLGANTSTQPIAIPGSAPSVPASGSSFSSSSQGKLKADAPIFQPSFSPVSPNNPLASLAGGQALGGEGPAGAKGRGGRTSFSGEESRSRQLSEQGRVHQQQLQQQQQAPRQQIQVQPSAQTVPPRFSHGGQSQRTSIRDMPLYEEEAVDDSNELPSPRGNFAQLAPNFQFGGNNRSQSQSHGQPQAQQTNLEETLAGMNIGGGGYDLNSLHQQQQSFGLPTTGGGGASSGFNASMLANIAARAGQRHQTEVNPMLEQQMVLQRQIELLQQQQRQLLQQNTLLTQGMTQPNQLSVLSQALLAQQAQQAHLSPDDQARLLQEQYIKVLTAQSIAQSQQIALQQAQAQLMQAQGQQSGPRDMRGKSINDFVLPNMSGSIQRPSSASNENPASGRSRQVSELSAQGQSHRRRNSTQTHRPQNSIIGSFGGFVADMPDDAVMAHHRANSRSVNAEWRTGSNTNKDAVLDLASAQAQLQMLSNFRSTQIGGGGHTKMASFSFPNMLPNLMMASTMGPATQSIVQQQQAFQMQLQQHNGPGPQRKSLFAPYLPQGSLPALLAAGKLVVGVLRVNKRNRSDAYVATDVLDADIYICGSKDRNRALEGDIVAVELLDVDEVWGSKKEKEEKKRKKEENAAYDQGFKQAAARKNDKKKDDVEVEGQGMVLFDDEEVTDEQKPTYAGHVVAVVERMTGQLFSGQLGVLRPSSAATKEKQEAERREREGDHAESETFRRPNDRPKIVWFKPTDKRVPLIAIPTEQAPNDFIDRPEAYAEKLFVATIKRWPITSLHPFGALVDELGTIGDIEVETSALLKDCNFPTEDFAEATMRCLPPVPWTIPEREYEIRRDMRSERVFTIDPETAKDLDDALSIKKNEDGTYEVGVHIADVSYFVKPNTALDRDARKRATSVYLVQRAVPMLPPLLSEELCSLVPDVERLTFSAFFKMDEEGNVLERNYAKTIIKSCAKLAYDDAQHAIEGQALGKPVSDGFKVADVEGDIKALHALSVKMRARRFKDGALKIEQPKLGFSLDELGKPSDVRPYIRKASHELIEEFMLLANMSVATVIANGLPEQALLRRHEPPIARRIEAFTERAKRLGYDFKGLTAAELQAGFEAIPSVGEKICLQILATRAMNRAKYFCVGMLDIAKYGHYALNVPLYTHFTSPIRRFADVLVHRMLEACLNTDSSEAKFVMDRDQVAKCAQHCNAKRDAAKIAQEQSQHLYLCFLIHDLTTKFGPVIREAQIVGVLDSAFDVVVPEFRIEKRVHADKMPLLNHVYDEHKRTLALYWSEKDVLSYLAEEVDDEYLNSVIAKSKVNAVATGADASESVQKERSRNQAPLDFKNTKVTPGGHRIQVIEELQSLPVMIVADVTKSPPVLQCLAISPFSNGQEPSKQ